jgi:molybdenum cofactor synthesis domain-containing protein
VITAAVITISDKGSRGEREDLSGPAIREMLAGCGIMVMKAEVVPDEREIITETLTRLCGKKDGVDLIVTTGGTGLSPRDVTPEATRAVVEREIPGIGEAMRAANLARTPRAMLSRGIAGIRGRTLIVNLPGSERAVRENLAVVLGVIPHAVEKIKGSTEDCA